MSQSVLYIASGRAAAVTMSQALSLSESQLLIFDDCLDGGPIRDFSSLDEWVESRKGYLTDIGHSSCLLQSLTAYFAHENPIERLRQADTIYFWAGIGLPEQLLLAWLVKLFLSSNIDPARLKLIEAYQVKNAKGKDCQILGVGELNPDQLLAVYQQSQKRGVSINDIEALENAWAALTASAPGKLVDYCDNAKPAFPFLHKGLHDFLRRYPNRHTGLGYFDMLLLKHASRGPKAARVLGYCMGEAYEQLDFTGDAHLFWRMKRLGASLLPYPALRLSGGPEMRDAEVTLTEMGESFLAGKENFILRNGVDDWIGGVHLTLQNMWWHHDGRLNQSAIPGGSSHG
ncbi:MAG: DUF1835 domain-containing protein [Alphaproteobacteria bacterium]